LNGAKLKKVEGEEKEMEAEQQGYSVGNTEKRSEVEGKGNNRARCRKQSLVANLSSKGTYRRRSLCT